MLRILYNFIKKAFACDSRMSGVVSRINKCENPVFKLFVNFSCLGNFRLYGNRIGSISCHITPIVINSLGGGHTHTHILTIYTGSILRNQVCAGLRPACAWFKNVKKVRKFSETLILWTTRLMFFKLGT